MGSVRGLVFELPEPIPITEGELRAVEILLGASLRETLAIASEKPLKHRSRR